MSWHLPPVPMFATCSQCVGDLSLGANRLLPEIYLVELKKVALKHLNYTAGSWFYNMFGLSKSRLKRKVRLTLSLMIPYGELKCMRTKCTMKLLRAEFKKHFKIEYNMMKNT